MANGIFMRWASAPAPGEPRRRPRAAAPGRLGWDEACPGGAEAALARLVERRPAARGPRRLVLCGGDDPALFAAAAAIARREGDEMAVLPPTRDGVADVPSLRLAVSERPAGGALVLLGAASPLGVEAPLRAFAEICAVPDVSLVLDLTFARYAPPPPEVAARTLAVLAALDRWDGAKTGTWGIAARKRTSARDEERAAATAEIDAIFRRRLADAPGARVWPLGDRPSAPGVATFALPGWPAVEAAELLAEAFGVDVDAGDALTAAPLPLPPGLQAGLIRAAIAPDTPPEDVERAAAAVARIAASAPARSAVH